MSGTVKQFLAYCRARIKQYKNHLLLQDYVIVLHDKEQARSDGAFQILCNVNYKRAQVYWRRNALVTFQNGHTKFIDRAIMHEMCHIPIHRLTTEAESRYTVRIDIEIAEEQAVDHFTNVICRLAGIKLEDEWN